MPRPDAPAAGSGPGPAPARVESIDGGRMATNGSERLTSISLLLLRVGAAGLLFYGHGLGKLANASERAGRFADPIGLGPELGFALVVFSEVVCAALVAVGFLTRIATVPILTFF